MTGLDLIERHPGFTLVRLSGGPYERGWQHGQLLRREVRSLRAAFYREIVYGQGRAWAIALQAVIAPIILIMRRHVPRELVLEMRGVADGAGVRYWDILVLNCFDDLLHSLWRIPAAVSKVPLLNRRFACSSFALLGERTASGRPLHGRNLDYEVVACLAAVGVVTKVLKESLVVFECRPEKGRAFLSVAWPGIVGVVTSLNDGGLSLSCLTSTTSSETANAMPLLLLYRLVSQYAGNLSETEQILRSTRRTIGNNLLVASGPENDARVFELAPQEVQSRGPRGGVVTTTNHFVHEAMACRQNGWVVPSSVDRHSRLDRLCNGKRFTPVDAAAVLRDTESLAADGDLWSALENPGTIYSSVAEPSSARLWLRANDRPERPFVELSASWARQGALTAV